MKKIYSLILLVVLSCSSDNNTNENDNCINDQVPLSSNINLTKISVYGPDQTTLFREYVVDNNNRLIESQGGAVSLYNNCRFVYNYNSCNQLTDVRCQNDDLLRSKLNYDSNGRLIEYRQGYQGGFTLNFEYTGTNTVIIKEYRGYNSIDDTHTTLNSTREWMFDSNDNMTTSIYPNIEYDYEYSNDNLIASTNNDFVINYSSNKNPFYLVLTNTYGRKNNFLINYGFDTIVYDNPTILLEELGLANSIISEWSPDSSTSNPIYNTEIVETSNGYATRYREITNGQVTSLVVVEYQ